MEQEIKLMPGLKLVVDEDKFEVSAALGLSSLPYGDYRMGFDLKIANVIEKTEQKVENLVVLRVK